MRRTWRAVVYILLSLYGLLVAVPMLWMVLSSLKTTRDLFSSPFGLPSTPQWSNFAVAWEQGLQGYVVNSFVVTIISVALIVVVSGLAAYALARLRFFGRVPVYMLLIAGYAIPIHTVLVPLYQTLNSLKMLNTMPGLIGPYVAFGVPFSVLLLYAFFIEFPPELEDAAHLDGCNTWQMMGHVVLPLSLPGLSSVAIFQGVFIWNEFLLALIVISNEGLKTLPLGLTTFQGQWSTNWPLMLASLTMATLPMLLLYIIMQRQFINSLTGFSK